MTQSRIHQFLSTINRLPDSKELTEQDILTINLSLEQEDDLRMYFAPHNEYINRQASIIICGITPGWKQSLIAFREFKRCHDNGENLDECLYHAKLAAGFAGTMRSNLIGMLNACGIPETTGITDAANLFGNDRNLLHTTSVIKYPVFYNGKNYTGHQPAIAKSGLLRKYAYHVFPAELAEVRKPALVIPLGKAVEHVIDALDRNGELPHHTYLKGFPHPSGANGHRIRQFRREKGQMQQKVKAWGLG